ncbi:MAG TPA: hypothetical protein VMB75_04045, partial [Rhodocyclaceae bacterium]|nr:hypothetical protein [Rhodocyclaceae bacterium]
ATPLAEVVAALNRYRKTPIALADPSLGDIRISGVFLLDDEQAAIAAIRMIAPVEFVPKAAKIEARRRPAG